MGGCLELHLLLSDLTFPAQVPRIADLAGIYPSCNGYGSCSQKLRLQRPTTLVRHELGLSMMDLV